MLSIAFRADSRILTFQLGDALPIEVAAEGEVRLSLHLGVARAIPRSTLRRSISELLGQLDRDRPDALQGWPAPGTHWISLDLLDRQAGRSVRLELQVHREGGIQVDALRDPAPHWLKIAREIGAAWGRLGRSAQRGVCSVGLAAGLATLSGWGAWWHVEGFQLLVAHLLAPTDDRKEPEAFVLRVPPPPEKPFDRAPLAAAIRECVDRGPRLIALDVGLDLPAPNLDRLAAALDYATARGVRLLTGVAFGPRWIRPELTGLGPPTYLGLQWEGHRGGDVVPANALLEERLADGAGTDGGATLLPALGTALAAEIAREQRHSEDGFDVFGDTDGTAIIPWIPIYVPDAYTGSLPVNGVESTEPAYCAGRVVIVAYEDPADVHRAFAVGAGVAPVRGPLLQLAVAETLLGAPAPLPWDLWCARHLEPPVPWSPPDGGPSFGLRTITTPGAAAIMGQMSFLLAVGAAFHALRRPLRPTELAAAATFGVLVVVWYAALAAAGVCLPLIASMVYLLGLTMFESYLRATPARPSSVLGGRPP
jgi:hypothetical protein